MKRCHVKAKLFRCFMLREMEGSSTNAILIYVNGTTLRFTIKDFAIISGLKCSDNESEFCFHTDQPNRIMVEYFSGQSSFTKVRLIASYRAKIVVKVSSHIPRIINWVTKKDHPHLDYLMRTIFKEVDNSITFRKIEPTTMKIKILQLPLPTIQSISPDPHIECSNHNKAIESDSDFQHPPFITTIKGKEKVIERSSHVNKKNNMSLLVQRNLHQRQLNYLQEDQCRVK
ncbi:hypothetical protein MTR67_031683 [Solanum verrucosum]|uniref:DUF1985 domain-containing protein n=1 Tax=Solanum verrucosum TaxID=315347 RepID=A0AAF0ZGM1_SOLVR|nr:hypothetical protein MTR67_031683 [Solanum verrucosum]